MLRLDFHGVRADIICADSRLLEEYRRDFSYFISSLETPTHIRLEVRREPAPRVPFRTLLKWRSARIGHSNGTRQVDYEGRARLEYDLERESGTLFGEDLDLLHELGYLTVLSRVGERLDLQGLHRIHALGFTYQGRGGLLILPMNGGKSRLGLELLGREGFGLLSDDIPLLDASDLAMKAFPMSLSLRGDDWRGISEKHLRVFTRRRYGAKRLVDVDYFRDRVGDSAPLSWILLGERDGRQAPKLASCSKARATAGLFSPMVLGAGTPQILELMLPAPPFAGGAMRLAQIAWSRAACAAKAAACARCGLFRLGGDPKVNADALESFLQEESLQ
jgi:hypothetical protein